MGLMSKAREIRGEPEPLPVVPPVIVAVEKPPAEKKKKLPKAPPPVPASKPVVKPVLQVVEKVPELVTIPEPVDEQSALNSQLWGMEYEGKEGLTKLKKIADNVGVKYEPSWARAD